jgi:hypothetical protein
VTLKICTYFYGGYIIYYAREGSMNIENFLILTLTTVLFGCTNTSKDTNEQDQSALEVIGNYEFYFGTTVITERKWIVESDGTSSALRDFEVDIYEYSNEENYVIGQYSDGYSSASDEQWLKLEWTTKDDSLLFCFGSPVDSKESALETSLDASDLIQGCLGEPWFELKPAFELTGSYLWIIDDWTLVEINISSFKWEHANETYFLHNIINEEENYIIALNDEYQSSSPYYAGLWTRIDYTPGTDGSWYRCYASRQNDTIEEALAATPADPTDLEEGCIYPDGSGGKWREIVPQ